MNNILTEQDKYSNRNMIAKCHYCEWSGYVEDCNIGKEGLECPECNVPVSVYGDDFD